MRTVRSLRKAYSRSRVPIRPTAAVEEASSLGACREVMGRAADDFSNFPRLTFHVLGLTGIPASTHSTTWSRPLLVRRLVNRTGRSPRIFLLSRSITARSAPT